MSLTPERSSSAVVLVEAPAPGVRLLRIHRPEARNALNMEVRLELSRRIDEFGGSSEVLCIILAGDAKSFAAGADIKERVTMNPVEKMHSDTEKNRLARSIAGCSKPLIAAVRGYALGGGFETALMCDIIVAGESAKFGLPELGLGVIPGSGGTQRFARIAGKQRALFHILTAKQFTAQQAFDMGVVSAVTHDDAVESTAIELAGQISRLAPLAVQQAKAVLVAGIDAPLEVGLALEMRASQLLYATEDQKEGMRAFIEKRSPKFTGR